MIYNSWFFKTSKLNGLSTLINEHIIWLEAHDLNNICIFLLVNLIRMTYFIKLNINMFD